MCFRILQIKFRILRAILDFLQTDFIPFQINFRIIPSDNSIPESEFSNSEFVQCSTIRFYTNILSLDGAYLLIEIRAAAAAELVCEKKSNLNLCCFS